MAEPVTFPALVPPTVTTTVQAQPVNTAALELASYQLPVKELDALGRATTYAVALPSSGNFAEWSIYQQVAMLKAGAWNKYPIWMIVAGIAYAKNAGVDIQMGDVFPTGDGRLGLSNKAKIKIAYRSGLIEDAPQFSTIETDEPIQLEGYDGMQLECTVSVKVKGWSTPLKKTQKLSEWYVPKNPNWRTRPQHMLELNTLAHALEYVSPYAETTSDEAPPLTVPMLAEKDIVTQALEEALLKK